MKRLLICSTGIPHPAKGASMVVLHHYVRTLLAQGYDVMHVIALSQSADRTKNIEEYRSANSEVRVLVDALPRFTRETRSLRFFPRIDSRPLSEAVQQAILDFSPDTSFSFDVESAGLLHNLSIPRSVVWLGDLHFETSWYHSLYAVKESFARIIDLPKAWLRSRAWKKFYARVLGSVDMVMVCAKSSEKQMASIGITATYLPYPWPEGDRGTSSASALPTIPTFVFLGNLSGLGSRSALHLLLKKIYPLLRKRWGGGSFSIVLCGSEKLPEWVQSLLVTRPEITFLGFVEDISGLLRSSHGALVPIDVPVGNRTRIITAMAARVPVVAHVNTALGNPSLIDGETCYLASDADGFVQRMEKLVKRGSEVDRMIDAAYTAYQKEYAPAPACAAFVRLLDSSSRA